MALRPGRQHPTPRLDGSGHCDDDVIEEEFLDLLNVRLRQALRFKCRQLDGQIDGQIIRHIAPPCLGA